MIEKFDENFLKNALEFLTAEYKEHRIPHCDTSHQTGDINFMKASIGGCARVYVLT